MAQSHLTQLQLRAAALISFIFLFAMFLFFLQKQIYL